MPIITVLTNEKPPREVPVRGTAAGELLVSTSAGSAGDAVVDDRAIQLMILEELQAIHRLLEAD